MRYDFVRILLMADTGATTGSTAQFNAFFSKGKAKTAQTVATKPIKKYVLREGTQDHEILKALMRQVVPDGGGFKTIAELCSELPKTRRSAKSQDENLSPTSLKARISFLRAFLTRPKNDQRGGMGYSESKVDAIMPSDWGTTGTRRSSKPEVNPDTLGGIFDAIELPEGDEGEATLDMSAIEALADDSAE